MIVLEHLVNKIRSSGAYNSAVQTEPACILWPDPEQQWSGVLPKLLAAMPELFVLGDYIPEKKRGPGIWLRCAVSGLIEGNGIPDGLIPVIYLPRIGRQNLRDVRNCPDELKPLMELQYRGTVWSQVNSKDWTVFAFLKSELGGLGLDVAQDLETKSSMLLALPLLLEEELEILEGRHLDKEFFNTLLSGGDPIRDLLSWIDQGDAFRAGKDDEEWRAFVAICKSNYAFDPQKEGVLAAAAKLAEREGPWKPIWERFCESPRRYPQIPTQIWKCEPPTFDLFADATSAGGWPQWNKSQESTLESELLALGGMPEDEARKRIVDLEKHHGARRSLVWAELGAAPLAVALEHLNRLVEASINRLVAGSINDLATSYGMSGWQADEALLRALQSIDRPDDLKSVSEALKAVYRPWAEDAARYLQKIVDESSYPAAHRNGKTPAHSSPNECVVFVDGLRYDVAKQLSRILESKGLVVNEKQVWAALPSVTATGKPAVSPVIAKLSGESGTIDFEPSVTATGQSLKGGYQLKKLLNEEGWEILDGYDSGTGDGKGWCEFGDIDHEGHSRGWRLAKHIGVILNELADRIESLLAAGWTSVSVVTDHGWLLMPGGLPKAELPVAVTNSKWGRCAAIKPGAIINERLFSWYWNPTERFALADGISCFGAGEEYAHGGLSLQECLTLSLLVCRSIEAEGDATTKITSVAWRGLRCSVAIGGSLEGSFLDIRSEPGNSASTLIPELKPLEKKAIVSVIVEDEDRIGNSAFVVVVDGDHNIVAQKKTVVGGEIE